jgi:integrase
VTRVTIAEYGAKRAKIRVFTEGELARVQWRIRGRLKTESFPNTAAGRATAKAFAKGVADARIKPNAKERITLRELWNRFAEAEFLHLRDKTKKLYTEYFARWLAMWTADFIVEETTLAMMHEFRTALTKLGLQNSTIRQTIQTVKMVYAWGEANDLIDRNRLHLYRFKVSRDEKRESPAEYTADERAKILGGLDPTSATQWRPWVALQICANQGVRQNAVLHLKWDDVDFTAGIITWRSQWDKMGREWTQPIRAGTSAALEIALQWRGAMDYEGPWVLPAGSSKNSGNVYTIQSLWAALKAVEARSGVARLKQRGGHALRRQLAGDVNAATGDPALALLSIGDTDLRQANSYLKKRDSRVKAAFDRLDADVKAPDQEPKE